MSVVLRIFFLSLLFPLGMMAAQDTGHHIVHLKGGVTLLADKAKSPSKAKFADVIHRSDSLFMDKGAELKLAHLNGIEIWLAASASFRWYGFEEISDGFFLDSGAVQVETEAGAKHPFDIIVPHGRVNTQQALYRLHRQRDGRAILDLEKGIATVFHTQKMHELQGPIKVIIDEAGVRPLEDGKFKSRAIFDFREEDKLSLEEILEEKKKNEEEIAKGSVSQDLTVKGKASDAKLVEGSADGEGEYHWDFSVSPWFLLIPLVLFVVIALYFRKHQQKVAGGPASGKPKAGGRDDYESSDVYVWRGNLTTNDPPLRSKKATHILGDVEDGVKLECHHDLVIKGSIQGAEVIATKNLTVETGINGQDKALLMIGGELKASYISETKGIVLGDVSVQQAIHGCTLAINGQLKVEKKNIVGGWVSSLGGIRCQVLGSDFAETEILLGEPATKAWAEKTGEELAWDEAESKGISQPNPKASLEVMEEWISATVVHGEARLEQKDPIPGPLKTRIDPTDRTRLQMQGFKLEDDE